MNNDEKFFYMIPTLEQEKQALDYVSEFQAYNSPINGAGGLNKHVHNYSGWIHQLEENRHRAPSETQLPSETFFLVRKSDGRIVGMSNVRLALNENQKKHGGHVGFSIRPTERLKGYNKINLFLALLVLKSHRISEAFLDCESQNIGSYKTIEALGGKLIDERYDDEEDFCFVKYFRIDVNDSIEKYRNIYENKIDMLPA